MDKDIRSKLENVGVDVEDLMKRLMGNMMLISRFYKRFPEDKNYDMIVKYLSEDMCEEAFKAAHTLKGVCANLSMTKLVAIVSEMVEYLREGDLEDGKKILPKLSEEYETIVTVVKSIQWQ